MLIYNKALSVSPITTLQNGPISSICPTGATGATRPSRPARAASRAGLGALFLFLAASQAGLGALFFILAVK